MPWCLVPLAPIQRIVPPEPISNIIRAFKPSLGLTTNIQSVEEGIHAAFNHVGVGGISVSTTEHTGSSTIGLPKLLCPDAIF